jgi:hypothetical protein
MQSQLQDHLRDSIKAVYAAGTAKIRVLPGKNAKMRKQTHVIVERQQLNVFGKAILSQFYG